MDGSTEKHQVYLFFALLLGRGGSVSDYEMKRTKWLQHTAYLMKLNFLETQRCPFEMEKMTFSCHSLTNRNTGDVTRCHPNSWKVQHATAYARYHFYHSILFPK